MCGLLRGFDTGIIAGALLLISSAFHLEDSPGQLGIIATSATIGAVLGTAIAGRVADTLGRKRALLLGAVLSCLGSCVCTAASTVSALLVGRVVSGVAFGFYSTAVNVHLAECAAPASRGALLTLPQVAVSSGIALSYLYSVIVILWGGGFRAMLAASSVMSVGVAFSVWLMPESPRWLLQEGRGEDAKEALCQLRGGPTKAVELEWSELASSTRRSEVASAGDKGGRSVGKGGWGLHALFRERSVVRSLAVCCTLQALQQLSGINAIIYFTPQVLQEAGTCSMFTTLLPSLRRHPSACSLLATLASYLPKLPAILLAMYLVDRVGRRMLLLTMMPPLAGSLAALAVSLSLPQSCWYRSQMALLSLSVYGIFFVLSLGPMPNMITGELLPTDARGAGMSVSVGVQWVLSSLVSVSFPILCSSIGTGPTFMCYSAIGLRLVLRPVVPARDVRGFTRVAPAVGEGKGEKTDGNLDQALQALQGS
eukprot:CAMPEP_0172002658 /NCGR_PEP_ID=MMETSP1041-20130122/3524_1 /TAXON_ID=464988 /ORGANISM="Hemiselmis andersenii, Strain CCMP439" /LENGTH=481 /DNA_ID=CAMNT_0012656387 /DNA_START=308 /DNA_END=1749 /DNA_ORIENTATION=+